MPTLVLSTPLAARIGTDRVAVEGASVSAALAALETAHAPLAGWLLDDQRRLREHVNVFLDGRSVTLDQTVGSEDELFIIQAISGG